MNNGLVYQNAPARTARPTGALVYPHKDYVTYDLLRDNDIDASSGPDDACAKTGQNDQSMAMIQPRQVDAMNNGLVYQAAPARTARPPGALVYPHRDYVTYELLRDNDIDASSGPDDACAKAKQTQKW